MNLTEMGSREKAVLAILSGVILVTLIGIGFLAAELLGGGDEEGVAGEIVVAPTAPSDNRPPRPTVTLVAEPRLGREVSSTPLPISAQPVVVIRVESPGPMMPVILAGQALSAGHRYRLEITAADGSKTAVIGSWSQAASNAQGAIKIVPAQPVEGVTPLRLDFSAPVANPSLWSVSASAGAQDLLSPSPALVLTLWDVTGSQ